jgi:hypothetical protein
VIPIFRDVLARILEVMRVKGETKGIDRLVHLPAIDGCLSECSSNIRAGLENTIPTRNDIGKSLTTGCE